MIHSKDLPPDVLQRLGVKPRRSKYNAKRTTVDGINFASQREAKRYGELCLLKAAGDVTWFIMQAPFRLAGGTIYRSDFLIVWADGRVTVEDAKGMKTPTYVIKKREVEHQYGIEITEV